MHQLPTNNTQGCGHDSTSPSKRPTECLQCLCIEMSRRSPGGPRASPHFHSVCEAHLNETSLHSTVAEINAWNRHTKIHLKNKPQKHYGKHWWFENRRSAHVGVWQTLLFWDLLNGWINFAARNRCLQGTLDPSVSNWLFLQDGALHWNQSKSKRSKTATATSTLHKLLPLRPQLGVQHGFDRARTPAIYDLFARLLKGRDGKWAADLALPWWHTHTYIEEHPFRNKTSHRLEEPRLPLEDRLQAKPKLNLLHVAPTAWKLHSI